MPRIKHGQARAKSHTSIYDVWQAMRQRCSNPNYPQWKDYGGRGIRVCKRWDDFALFASDMGPRPGPGMIWTLDRWPNNDGDYEPTNCRWATRRMQQLNARGWKLTQEKADEIRRRAASGETQRALGKEFGIDHSMVGHIARGEQWAHVE